MARATGLELTESSVRVVELEGSPRRYRITGAMEVALDQEQRSDPAGLAQAVKAALKGAKAHKDEVILGLPARDTVIREITIPFTDPDQIRKVIKFESEAHVHGVDVDEIIVDFHKIAQIGNRSRVLIIVARKEVLRRHLEVCARAGVDPQQVDLDAAGLFSVARLVPEVQEIPEEQAQLLLDLGRTNSTVVVFNGGHLRMVRSMRLGSESIARMLATDLGLPWDEAQSATSRLLAGDGAATFALADEADPGQREPSTALAPAELQEDALREKAASFDRRVVVEIRRSLSSAQLEGRLGAVWLTGPASGSPTLAGALEEALGVHVGHLDTLHNADHSLDPEASTFVGSPSGLALKALGHDPLGLEFRREDLRFTRRFEKIQTPLMIASGLVFLILAFLTINEIQWVKAKSTDAMAAKSLEIFSKQFADIYTQPREAAKLKILGYENAEQLRNIDSRLRSLMDSDPSKVPQATSGALLEPLEDIRRRYGLDPEGVASGGPETQVASALERLESFVNALESVKDKLPELRIERLRVSSEEVAWDMTARNPDYWTLLSAAFEKMDGYVDAKRGQDVPSPPNRLVKNNIVRFEQEERY